MYPPLCEGGWCSVSSKPPRGVPIPPRPRHDRRDSGASAAVWGWMVCCLLKTPTGRPYPPVAQAGPEGIGCIRRCVRVDGVVSPRKPHWASLSPRGPGKTGGTRVYPPLCGGGWCAASSKPPRGVPIPPRPSQDRRDSGVSAAVWGWMVRCLLKSPTGRPYPPVAQAGPEGIGCIRRCVRVDGVVFPQKRHGAALSPHGPGKTGGTRVYPPLCGGGRCGASSLPLRGVPIPPRPRHNRRDSGVSAAVWGWMVWCLLKTPTGRPYPPVAQAGPEGLGYIRRCVGVDGVGSPQNPHGAFLSPRGPGITGGTRVYPPLCEGGWCRVSSKPPRGVPIPPRPRQDRRDSGISTTVWGWMVWCLLKTPTGRPYPPAAPAGPEGIGCMRRCVRVDGVVSPQKPHGKSLSPRGPGRTARTLVYPPLCGDGWCGASLKPPRGVPIPPRPSQDRRDSGVSAAVWRWMV